MEISFPPSALYADTQVSIQPINNDDLDGIGPGYQLSPEGTQFNQPVMLTWHLSDADMTGHAITDATIATRDENGAWKAQADVKYDAAAKIVRVATSHFCSWKATWKNYLPNITITPTQDDVNINKSVYLQVTSTKIQANQPEPSKPTNRGSNSSTAPPTQQADGGAPGKTSGGVDEVAPGKGHSDDDLLAAPALCQWKVNGSAPGNPTYGYISQEATSNKAKYTAPAKIPKRNPVRVSCEMKTGHARVIAISNITITDKRGWSVDVRYKYREEHSVHGPTGFGTTATNWGEATRDALVHFHVYSDSRYAAGAVGGMGKGDILEVEKGGMENSMCYVKDDTLIEGPLDAEGDGVVSKAGQLKVLMHNDSLKGHSHHSGTCNKGVVPDKDWDSASFGVSCNFTGVDYEKGGTFSADVPSDRGKGKCELTIAPM